MSTFIEERLLDCVTYGTQGGPTWLTRKVGLKSGIIRRNAVRSRPLYRYSVIYRNLLPSSHAEVIGAFNACRGGAYSFRLKDWADFEAQDELLTVLGDGSEQEIQLIKTYAFGSEAIARPIRKPVSGTVVVTADGSPIAATVNYATGIITVTAGSGDIIRWSGEFDVPVMFMDDELLFSGDDKGAEGLFLTSDVALLEDISA
jgi:uncharacterized protein (TIGR02217 family)